MPGSLVGITYSEFDNHVGPQLKYSYPVDVLSKELFEAFSDYVIVSKQLCEKSIVVSFDELNFLNYSVAIDNQKYFRNTLIFSFGFILVKGVDTQPYETALKKISSTFVNLEIETEYLFQAESKQRLQDFLRTLYNDLNNNNEACIRFDNMDNYLAVKLYRAPAYSLVIQDYDVPILNSNHNMDLSTLPWDISFQHLIPFVDGKSHVKKIVRAIDMDGDFVKRSLKLLLFHEYVILSDIFRFSNVYALTSIDYALSMLSDGVILSEMRDFCAIEICGIVATLPSNNQLIHFLLKFQQNKTVQEIVLDSIETVPVRNTSSSSLSGIHNYSLTPVTSSGSLNTDNSSDYMNPRLLPFKNMDISRAIAYACSKNILRRMHEYPVYSSPEVVQSDLAQSVALPSVAEDSVYMNTLQNSRSSLFLAGSAASTHKDPVPFASSSNRRLSFGGSSSSSGVEEHKEHRPALVSRDDGSHDLKVPRTHSSSMSVSERAPVNSSKPVSIGVRAESNKTTTGNSQGTTVSTATPGESGSYVVGNEIPLKDASSGSPPTIETSGGSFQKLSRSRSVVGRNYLSSSSPGAEILTSYSTCASPNQSTRVKCLADIITTLTGKLHIDELCVKYNVNYSDIVSSPGVTLLYK